jgi:hypothetical protein
MEKITDRIIKIEAFFDAYAKRFNEALKGREPDIQDAVNAFAASFIEASPKGIIAGKNDAEFKKAIPKGYEYYKSIGTTAMHVMATNITLLDALHSITQVGWKADYEKQDGSTTEIEFEVFYLLHEEAGRLKIFAYITGDEEKVLHDRGLIPYK